MKTKQILSEEAIRVLKDMMGDTVRLSTGKPSECWLITGPSLGVREVSIETAESLVDLQLVKPTHLGFGYDEYQIDVLLPEDAAESTEERMDFSFGYAPTLGDEVKFLLDSINTLSRDGADRMLLPRFASAAAQQVIIDLGYKIEDGRISWQPSGPDNV